MNNDVITFKEFLKYIDFSYFINSHIIITATILHKYINKSNIYLLISMQKFSEKIFYLNG